MKQPEHVADLETPALLLDLDRVEGNIARYQKIADYEHVKLRPHGKTTKMPEVWKMQQKAGAKGLTVATVKEAEVAYSEGIQDILIAYPHVDEASLRRISLLGRKGKIAMLVANREGAEIVRNFFKGAKKAPDILLAIDTGLHREGVAPYQASTLKLIANLAEWFGDRFRGISTHEGQSYKVRHPETAQHIAMRARDIMIATKEACETAGIPLREVALGSTPTFAYFENDPNHTITEAHPGNYVLMDHTQVQLDVAKPDECALTALATIIDRKVARQTHHGETQRVGRVFINTGAKILSEAKRPHGAGGMMYGRVYHDLEATDLEQQGGRLVALSEEIGWVDVPPEALDATDDEGKPLWKIGRKIRVLVQHSCPTVACNDKLWEVRGDRVIRSLPIPARGYR